MPPWAPSAPAAILLSPRCVRTSTRARPAARMEAGRASSRNDPEDRQTLDALGELAAGLACRNERGTTSLSSSAPTNLPSTQSIAGTHTRRPSHPAANRGSRANRAGTSGIVADPFAGVATTALALQHHPDVSDVVGVEYSPFAHFAGRAKLRGRRQPASGYALPPSDSRNIKIDPSAGSRTSAFSNQEIFQPAVVTQLVSAREAVSDDRRA